MTFKVGDLVKLKSGGPMMTVTRVDNFGIRAEKCERQAKTAGSATAMFTLLDLAEDLRGKAAQAEMEDKDSKQE